MRFLYGIGACILWTFVMAYVTAKYKAEIPVYVQWLSTAIVIAGAMAGGD